MCLNIHTHASRKLYQLCNIMLLLPLIVKNFDSWAIFSDGCLSPRVAWISISWWRRREWSRPSRIEPAARGGRGCAQFGCSSLMPLCCPTKDASLKPLVARHSMHSVVRSSESFWFSAFERWFVGPSQCCFFQIAPKRCLAWHFDWLH